MVLKCTKAHHFSKFSWVSMPPNPPNRAQRLRRARVCFAPLCTPLRINLSVAISQINNDILINLMDQLILRSRLSRTYPPTPCPASHFNDYFSMYYLLFLLYCRHRTCCVIEMVIWMVWAILHVWIGISL